MQQIIAYYLSLGIYNPSLSKMVYLDSRRFVPITSPLRSDKRNFPSKSKEILSPPTPTTYDEVKNNHKAYESAKTK